jgi:murein DD-endopeptidase MepM/ murein hydrolase activator NlpD
MPPLSAVVIDYYKSEDDTGGWCNGDIIRSGSDTISILIGGAANSFSFPFQNYITSPFGPRGSYFHSGIDIKLRIGDTIRAVFDGTARVATVDKGGYGKLIILRHKNGLETLYAHLSKLLINQNATVLAGDVIALGGNTGRSTGSHLHFECRHCGEPFDPLTFLNFENYALVSDTLKLTFECFGGGFNQSNAFCHRVKKGDTLSGIASKYRMSVKTLCRLNNITPQTVLKIGKNLILRNGS